MISFKFSKLTYQHLATKNRRVTTALLHCKMPGKVGKDTPLGRSSKFSETCSDAACYAHVESIRRHRFCNNCSALCERKWKHWCPNSSQMVRSNGSRRHAMLVDHRFVVAVALGQTNDCIQRRQHRRCQAQIQKLKPRLLDKVHMLPKLHSVNWRVIHIILLSQSCRNFSCKNKKCCLQLWCARCVLV